MEKNQSQTKFSENPEFSEEKLYGSSLAKEELYSSMDSEDEHEYDESYDSDPLNETVWQHNNAERKENLKFQEKVISEIQKLSFEKDQEINQLNEANEGATQSFEPSKTEEPNELEEDKIQIADFVPELHNNKHMNKLNKASILERIEKEKERKTYKENMVIQKIMNDQVIMVKYGPFEIVKDPLQSNKHTIDVWINYDQKRNIPYSPIENSYLLDFNFPYKFNKEDPNMIYIGKVSIVENEEKTYDVTWEDYNAEKIMIFDHTTPVGKKIVSAIYCYKPSAQPGDIIQCKQAILAGSCFLEDAPLMKAIEQIQKATTIIPK